jgi:iron complex outermembrane receptor protein
MTRTMLLASSALLILPLSTAAVAADMSQTGSQSRPPIVSGQPSAVAAEANPVEASTAQPDSSTAPSDSSTTAEANTGSDIVVTAQKRSQRLQSVPLTIQAFGAAQLTERRVTNITALTNLAPSVNISGFSNQRVSLFIRGIGTRQLGPTTDQSVGVFIDDFYAGDSSALFGGLTDIERIEVLKGPQGTLYGRNTIAGAISVVTSAPSSTPEGKIEASLGNLGLVEVKGSISGPIAGEKVLGRLSFYSTKRRGYMYNPLTGNTGLGQDVGGLRGKLLFHLTSDLTATVTGDYTRDTSPGQLGKNQGPRVFGVAPGVAIPPIDPDPFRNAANIDGTTDATNYGGNLRLEWQQPSVTLLSLTQYRHNRYRALSEIDQSPLDILTNDSSQSSHNFSQEFRLSSDPSGQLSLGGKLDWIVGLFYYSSSAQTADIRTFGKDSFAFSIVKRPIVSPLLGSVDVESYAAYVDATLHITDTISINGGLRYSKDKKDGVLTGSSDAPGTPTVTQNYSVPLRLRSDSLDPKIAINWKPSEDILAYAFYSSGYKSGGFQFTPSTALIARQVYGPERVNYFEGGVKTQFFDRRLTVNLAGFYGKYRGLQLNRIIATSQFTGNAASVNLRGIELETRATVTDRLSANVSYTYLNNKFASYDQCRDAATTANCFDLTGTPIARSPKHQIIAGARYKLPIDDVTDLTFGADWTHRSKSLLELGGFGAVARDGTRLATVNPLFVEPSNDVVDLRATLRRGNVSFAGWVTNLLNEAYSASPLAFPSTIVAGNQIGNSFIRYFAPSRMYGVTLSSHF